MDSWFQQLPFQGKPYLWSYRNWSTQDFEGYYHWHHGCELLIVHQGCGSVIVNQHTYEIRPGMLFFFQPFQLHKVYAQVAEDNPYERSVFHFDAAQMDNYLIAFPTLRDAFTHIRQGLVHKQAYDLSKDNDAVSSVCQNFNSFKQSAASPLASNEQAAMFLLQLLSFIRREINDEGYITSRKQMQHSERIMEWVERHYAETFELDRLANDLHMSKSYLSRLFRLETGSSITDYLTARRIQQACKLLQSSDQPIEHIGEQVGLPNVSYFIQLFKRFIGTTPHQYRLKL